MNLTRTSKKIILMVLDVLLIICSLFISENFLDVITQIDSNYFRISIILIPLFYLVAALFLKVFSTINRFTDYKTLGFVGLSIIISYFGFTIFSLLVFKAFSLRFIFLCVLLLKVVL